MLPLKEGKPDPRGNLPATLQSRLQHLPALATEGLWPAQVKAIRNLETSLADDRPRALIQMATGSVWLKDESLEDSANLPDPNVIAGELVEDLRTALEQFEAIQTDLARR